MIETEADLEALDAAGRTSLHLPVYHEISGMVKALVGAGANANLTGFLGLPLLHWAPMKGDAGSVAVLLNGMIRTNALDRRGRNARHYAEPEAVPFKCSTGGE